MPTTQSDRLKTYIDDTLDPMILHASKSPIPDATEELDLGTIVECDFLGYAAIPLTDFDTTDNEEEDIGDVLTEPLAFTADLLLVTPQTVYFFYITKHPVGAPVQLMHVMELPEPVQIREPNQSIDLAVRMNSEGLA